MRTLFLQIVIALVGLQTTIGTPVAGEIIQKRDRAGFDVLAEAAVVDQTQEEEKATGTWVDPNNPPFYVTNLSFDVLEAIRFVDSPIKDQGLKSFKVPQGKIAVLVTSDGKVLQFNGPYQWNSNHGETAILMYLGADKQNLNKASIWLETAINQ